MCAIQGYLGYLLAGIMLVYSVSGIILIYRDTDTFKISLQFEQTIEPGLTRIIHYAPIPKPIYLQSLEMFEIFMPQNWVDN